ncbi:MAG: RNA methyltransferase [Planctomycetota bacterium]
MPERIHDSEDPRVEAYKATKDHTVLARHGAFIAEGRLVVEMLLSGGSIYRARSVLVGEASFRAMEVTLTEAESTGVEVYIADQTVLDSIAGFPLHRGCLAVGERGPELGISQVLGALGEGRTVFPILEGLANHDNVGSIVRSAAAFGARAIIRSPRCCDPLYRKAIRVSMGHVLRLPVGVADEWPGDLQRLRDRGVKLIALVADERARTISSVVRSMQEVDAPIGVMIGTEGDGLSEEAIGLADELLHISIAPDVDSLNAGVAAAIAMQRLNE